MKLYTVSPISPGLLHIIDAANGTLVNRIVYTGELINGPIVVGDKCTFVIQLPSKQKLGRIHKIPTGHLLNQYPV
jgi:hypothetical protein